MDLFIFNVFLYYEVYGFNFNENLYPWLSDWIIKCLKYPYIVDVCQLLWYSWQLFIKGDAFAEDSIESVFVERDITVGGRWEILLRSLTVSRVQSHNVIEFNIINLVGSLGLESLVN